MQVRVTVAGHEVLISTVDRQAMVDVMNRLGQVHASAGLIEEKGRYPNKRLAAMYDREAIKFYDIADELEKGVEK